MRSKAGSREAVRKIEELGVAWYEAAWKSMPEGYARRQRASSLRIADAVLTMMGRSDSLGLNRVAGFGVRGEGRERHIPEIIRSFHAAGIRRFGFAVPPGPRAAAVESWLVRAGFKPHSATVLLARRAMDLIPAVRIRTARSAAAGASVRVRRIARPLAATWAHIACSTYGWPAGREPWVAASVGMSEQEHFLAFLGGQPIATGALATSGAHAWMGWGATTPKFRRHGAQGALIAARIRRARRRGCEWVVTETAEPLPGRPSGSYRNALRMGFHVAARKPTYVWVDPN